jgi:hypothetical protein
MLNDTLRWLLDIELIPEAAEQLRLAWERPLPPWLAALALAVAIAFAAWSYSRLAGRRGARIALATIRTLAIVLVIALLCGPAVEHRQESIEDDWLLVLLDRSASMHIQDVQAAGAEGSLSREQQLQRILGGNEDTWRKLADEHRIIWLGFDAGAYEISSVLDDGANDQPQPIEEGEVAAGPVVLNAPDGDVTQLGDAIEQALARAVARPISGIVLLTDGRTTQQPGRSVYRQLQNNAVKVFTVPLGSPDPLGDLALRRVDAPARAFVRDRVPVHVELDRLGEAASDLAATISLVDETTGETLDTIKLEPGDDRSNITLTAEPEMMGTTTWLVTVDTEPGDLVEENNWRRINIDLVDRPLRVLYIDGYPRWEYRYFKNLLIREQSIDSSVMLISADRDFAQEGNQPITRLPRSPEEFAQFDVIAIGDVPASFFSPEQVSLIRDQVAERGAGLLWIAGERWTPRTYAGTLLTDVLPMRGPLSLPPINEPVTMQPTPLAEQLSVLQLQSQQNVGWPNMLADPRTGWSRLYYAQRIEPARLKPTAEVLAQTVQTISGSELPLVIQMRYGAGRVIYVATDEIWRWRYGQGELFPEQFWIQIVRMLGRETLGMMGEQAALSVKPRWAATGEPARIEVVLLDQQLADAQRQTVRATIVREDGTPFAELDLHRVSDSQERYAGTAIIDQPGMYRVMIDDPTLGLAVRDGAGLSAELEVARQDDELRRPETDHPLLQRIADDTDGAVIAPDEISQLPERLPNRSIRTLHSLIEPIWDSPLALGLLLVLFTAEWVGRKIVRLA